MTARSIFSLCLHSWLVRASFRYKRKLSHNGGNVFGNTLTLTIDAVVSRKPVVRFSTSYTDISNISWWYGENSVTVVHTRHDESMDVGMSVLMESVSRDRLTRMYIFYVSSLPLLHSGNKMLYLCHYRRAGGIHRVGRTRRPHFLLLPPTKEEVHVFARVGVFVCLSVC